MTLYSTSVVFPIVFTWKLGWRQRNWKLFALKSSVSISDFSQTLIKQGNMQILHKWRSKSHLYPIFTVYLVPMQNSSQGKSNRWTFLRFSSSEIWGYQAGNIAVKWNKHKNKKCGSKWGLCRRWLLRWYGILWWCWLLFTLGSPFLVPSFPLLQGIHVSFKDRCIRSLKFLVILCWKLDHVFQWWGNIQTSIIWIFF